MSFPLTFAQRLGEKIAGELPPYCERPLLRYYGGKWRLAPWIISFFPAHTTYVEPFCGAASVLLRKEPSAIEVINDADREVVNLFRVLRERRSELRELLELTPYGRGEYLDCLPDSNDPLERARRFFVCHWQSVGHCRARRTGWKFFSRPKKLNGCTSELTDWQKAIESIPAAADRLAGVQLECADALSIILRYDTPATLFYVDPPYPANTRNRRWCKSSYAHELTAHDHVHLANLLNRIQGMAIVSTYPNSLYSELFAGWTRVEKSAQTMNKTIATEVLYLSPSTRLSAVEPMP
jgi:DNA adenine methylase